MTWITNPTTGIATNTETGATFQAANPLFSPPSTPAVATPAQAAIAVSSGVGSSTSSNGTVTNPVNLVNPGSVWQSYNPNTGVTSYGSAAAPMPAPGFYSGTGAAVATPTNIPANSGAMVANAQGQMVPLTAETGYSQATEAVAPTPGNYNGLYTALNAVNVASTQNQAGTIGTLPTTQVNANVNNVAATKTTTSGNTYIPDKTTLDQYTNLGLSKDDIVREGTKMYIKSDSPFAMKLKGLEIASARITAGTASSTDVTNVNYAKSKGWTPAGTVGGATTGGTTNENPNVVAGPATTALTEGIKLDAATLAAMGIGTIDEQEIYNDLLASPEFKLFSDYMTNKGLSDQAIADAAKQALEVKYADDRTTLENSLANKGLAFSGIRGTQVRALATSLAASELDVDRKLATQVLDLDYDLKNTILDMVAAKVKEAQSGRQEALGALKDAGLTLIGNTLVPTLAAQSEARQEEAQTFSQNMQMANYNLNVAKASQPTVAFETANEHRYMITYDQNGNILNTLDLGLAYKNTGGGGTTPDTGTPDDVDTWVAGILNHQAWEISNQPGAEPPKIDITSVPTKIRPAVLNRLMEVQQKNETQQATVQATQENSVWNTVVNSWKNLPSNIMSFFK